MLPDQSGLQRIDRSKVAMTSRKKEDAISPKAWPLKSQTGAARQRDRKGPSTGAAWSSHFEDCVRMRCNAFLAAFVADPRVGKSFELRAKHLGASTL
jgi:hypothetical protein